jgi:hypothetical protein
MRGLHASSAKVHVRPLDDDGDQHRPAVLRGLDLHLAPKAPPGTFPGPSPPVRSQLREDDGRVPRPVGQGHDGAGFQAVGSNADPGRPHAAVTIGIDGRLDNRTRLRDDITDLYDAWWDKRAPERNRAERGAATAARRRAIAGNWCAGAGLDDDQFDTPGYRPKSTWMPATAPDINPHISSLTKFLTTRLETN